MKNYSILRITAIFILAIVGSLALYGGWILMTDPTGDKFQFSLNLLENTPFTDYFIPGVILFVLMGLFSLLVLIFSLLKIRNYPLLIILEGMLLIGWLTLQLFYNEDFFLPILHYPLFSMGILLLIIGYFERRRVYSRK